MKNTRPARWTQLLILMAIAAATAAAFAGSYLNSTRDNALRSQRDRAQCLAELAELHAKSSASNQKSDPDDHAISRQLRGAAVAARLTDQLVSIDSGTPAPIQGGEFARTPIYVRLNAISLKQLVGFLYELSVTDDTLATTDIELSPPLTMPAVRTDPGDVWTADVTLSCLSVAARQPGETR